MRRINKKYILAVIDAEAKRSCYDRAVRADARAMLNKFPGELIRNRRELEKFWKKEYDVTWFFYVCHEGLSNKEIAEKYCTPSELKLNGHGKLAPNRWECWKEYRARALENSAMIVFKAMRKVINRRIAREKKNNSQKLDISIK